MENNGLLFRKLFKALRLSIMKKYFLIIAIISAMVVLVGCTVGPDYTSVKIKTGDIWHQKLVKGLSADEDITVQWWQKLNDPILDELIEEAKVTNLELDIAYWRVRQARASRDFVAGKYYPKVDAIGSYTRARQSDNGTTPPQPGRKSNDPYNMHSVGFDSVWEIDIWGKNKRAYESADASLQVQVEGYHDVMISLYAEVARNYIDMRTAQARLKYANENIESQRGMLEITESRFNSELTTELDVEQAKLNLANTKSQVPTFVSAENAAINRICVLLGKGPGELYEKLSVDGPIPFLPAEINVSLPAELLRQRPDIRKAERALASQNARIGVATADLYPTFSLNGNLSLTALDFSDLGRMSSNQYGFGPSIRWNIFDADRIKNVIRLEKAKTKEYYANYEQTVLLALEEVENSMTDYVQEINRRELLGQSVDSARKSVQMVKSLYTNGLTDFQNVLDMQRTLSQQEDNLAQSQGIVIQNLIRIYKAFGGGWDDSELMKVKEDQ